MVDLIEEARRRFPVGTEFRDIKGHIRKITGNTFRESINIHNSTFTDVVVDRNAVLPSGCSDWSVYYKGEWVEIVSLPKPEIINNYELY